MPVDEEFARLGCQVTGIDPSEPSLATAKAHAKQSGLDIDYRVGIGEDLPFPDETFDIVYCCDVLEHVNDLVKVIAEISRVLKKDGVFLYDTINQTLPSKLVMIKLFQEWSSTSFMPANTHGWNMFIKPRALQQLIISPRTVHAHVRSIYSKLAITSRSAATRYAIDHRLI
jgi:2-polyprenyl-6-hydroxyphenyl methylase/3-demethylubiquinone-9 3-methyltransferase